MTSLRRPRLVGWGLSLLCLAGLLSACSSTQPAAKAGPPHSTSGTSATTSTAGAGRATTTSPTSSPSPTTTPPLVPLPSPSPLTPFVTTTAAAHQGVWQPAGRSVGGDPAVFETTLTPPGGGSEAGIAWMDTRLLAARLYSGSKSPGGGPYTYTAPIEPAQAATLVAAFNGGFLMKDAKGGYYTQGQTIDPLVSGAASLVIYAGGGVALGAWGSDVGMTPTVRAVRQNLVPLVAGGQPTPAAASADWQQWGFTCGATNCGPGPGIEHQWRSGLGITANGALVYAVGPNLDPLQLADLLARAGAQRAMELDINPFWPVFATYDPPSGTPAAPANGTHLLSTTQGQATFFEASWARDFFTMSARVP